MCQIAEGRKAAPLFYTFENCRLEPEETLPGGTGNKHLHCTNRQIFWGSSCLFSGMYLYTVFLMGSGYPAGAEYLSSLILLVRSSFLHSQSLDMVSELKSSLKYCQQKQNALLGTNISHTNRHF